LKKPATIPFNFVLDQLLTLDPTTKPMFGCHAVYIGPKIMLILRNKETHTDDNGVWISTRTEHHATLKKIFPSMRSINVLGIGETNWQILPVDEDNFEESALKVCELILKGDPRIGNIPKSKKKKKKS
jgi:hypothetical protein